MLLHILKKDLKRKHSMNIILLLFVIMAAAFLASSVSNLITIQGAVTSFLEMAETPDFITIALSEEEKSDIDTFLKDCAYVTEYEVIDCHTIMEDEIEIISCANDPGRHKYEKGNTICIETVPEHLMKVFDQEGRLFTLKEGEIAIPKLQAEINNLQVGDILKLSCGDKQREFTIKLIVKDAVFGPQFMGFKRLFVSDQDYEWLYGDSMSVHTLLYGVNYEDKDAFMSEFNQENFQVVSSVDGGTIKMCYVFDMLIAGILLVVSICLILIAFLVLRFTIVFTLQEDYKEIGVMKAIGISDMGIKGIYLLKYFAIALFGSAVGLILSFPFEKLLLFKTMANLVVQDVESRAEINLLCAAAVIFVVILFCYSTTGKVKKFTAIEAIRNGGNGERFSKGSLLCLHKTRRMPPFVYLACNDVLSNVKQYLVLTVIFCMGTLLILIPLKAIHTLKDKNIIRSFNMQPASAFIDSGNMEKYIREKDDTLLISDLNQVKDALKAKGVEAEVWLEKEYVVSCYGSDPERLCNYYTSQLIGKEEEDYDLIEGKLPVFSNEIMVTEKTAEELGVGIGDYVYYQYPDREEAFLVTGLYQSMMNMGNGFRVSQKAVFESQYLGGLFTIQVEPLGDMEEEELKELLHQLFPAYKISTGNEYISSMIGGVLDQMDALQMLLSGVVLSINVLITVLMMKTLITKERGEIAILKSIGFSDQAIKGWQSIRILIVLGAAIFFGTLLSGPLSQLSLGPIFGMMGAPSMKLITRPFEAYVVYPVIMLGVTGTAAYLCASSIKKVDLKEINTVE